MIYGLHNFGSNTWRWWRSCGFLSRQKELVIGNCTCRLRQMRPYFASSSHNLYAKSAYIYLQKMLELPETHPDIHRSFLDGCHVIRSSNRYWAGLSSELIIEQVLMRSIKTNGGLTRGRGFTEIQRLVWLLSMPASADINYCMQELTGVKSDSSKQHKDCLQSRIIGDTEDTFKILSTLKLLNPFGPNPSLRGLVSGLSAAESVNVDDARSIGEKTLGFYGWEEHNEHLLSKKEASSCPGNKDSCTT